MGTPCDREDDVSKCYFILQLEQYGNIFRQHPEVYARDPCLAKIDRRMLSVVRGAIVRSCRRDDHPRNPRVLFNCGKGGLMLRAAVRGQEGGGCQG